MTGFDIELRATPGATKILVDGTDVANDVISVDIRASADHVPVVSLEMLGDPVRATGEGLVCWFHGGCPDCQGHADRGDLAGGSDGT